MNIIWKCKEWKFFGVRSWKTTLIYVSCISKCDNSQNEQQWGEWTTIYISLWKVFCLKVVVVISFHPPFMPFHFQFLSCKIKTRSMRWYLRERSKNKWMKEIVCLLVVFSSFLFLSHSFFHKKNSANNNM